MLCQRVIEEVQNAVTNLSSQCYPLGKLVAPLHAVENWIIGYGYPNFVLDEDELRELIFTDILKLMHEFDVNLNGAEQSCPFCRLVLCMACYMGFIVSHPCRNT